ncbi:MAG TPA: hypothetical protein VN088_08010 [Nocardioides sp.]|nr:hypothetical protein [Nocardioides sp.]
MAATAAVLLASGCGSHDAPRPGLAAEVDGTSLSLTALDNLVDAVCIATANAPQGQASSRGYVASQEVGAWITSQAFIQYGAQHGLPGARTPQDLSGVPGIDQMNADQRAALQNLIDDQAQANAINKLSGGLNLKPKDFDIVINPRFDMGVTDEGLVPTDQALSVAVSGDAIAGGGEPTAAQIAALPASQLCGRRPVIGSTAQ